MKTRSIRFWMISVLVVLIVWAMWHWRKRSTDIHLIEAASAASVSKSEALSQTNSSLEQVASNGSPAPDKSGRPSKGAQMKQGLAKLNDVSIVFYGRLEDQFGHPVVGAQIAADVRIYNGFRSGIKRLATVSDGDGWFHVDGGKGESLGLKPEKDGYVLATIDTYFKYSYIYPDHFTPDPDNPTVIKMWKLQRYEPLLAINQQYRLQYSAAPINIDLLSGKIVTQGGDLKIAVNRPSGEISARNPQDWGIVVEAIDGGLIETPERTEGVIFMAPESGYQSSETVTASSDRHGVDVIQQGLLVKSRSGQVYSRLGLVLGINMMPDDNMNIEVRGWANTNASRNWEATAY